MSAGVVGRIETVVQPVHRDRRLVIYANRAARFEVAGLACLDECHTFSLAVSPSDAAFCVIRPSDKFPPLQGRAERHEAAREDLLAKTPVPSVFECRLPYNLTPGPFPK